MVLMQGDALGNGASKELPQVIETLREVAGNVPHRKCGCLRFKDKILHKYTGVRER